MMNKRIGIIAGMGDLPGRAATEAKRLGHDVYVVGIKQIANQTLKDVASDWIEVRLGELGKLIGYFQKNQISEVIMLGKIPKINLFSTQILPDFEMMKALAGIKDWKDDSLLGAVAKAIEDHGIKILDSTIYLASMFAAPGLLFGKKLSEEQLQDVIFGWKVGKALGGLDVGQTVVVKSKSVMALEAIEGTDEAIRRGATYAAAGAVVIKIAKPNQDMRFDVPVIGPGTLKVMQECKASVLAVQSGKTLLIDKEQSFQIAKSGKITIIGIAENDPILMEK